MIELSWHSPELAFTFRYLSELFDTSTLWLRITNSWS